MPAAHVEQPPARLGDVAGYGMPARGPVPADSAGVSLVIGGFIPSPLETITQYTPTLPEISIVLGVWAIGFLILVILYKVSLGVREELEA